MVYFKSRRTAMQPASARMIDTVLIRHDTMWCMSDIHFTYQHLVSVNVAHRRGGLSTSLNHGFDAQMVLPAATRYKHEPPLIPAQWLSVSHPSVADTAEIHP